MRFEIIYEQACQQGLACISGIGGTRVLCNSPRPPPAWKEGRADVLSIAICTALAAGGTAYMLVALISCCALAKAKYLGAF
jgi:hypothetical protein